MFSFVCFPLTDVSIYLYGMLHFSNILRDYLAFLKWGLVSKFEEEEKKNPHKKKKKKEIKKKKKEKHTHTKTCSQR